MKIAESGDYIVAEFQSGLGASYAVGYPKSAGYTKETLESDIKAGESTQAVGAGGYCSLVWNVDGDSSTSRAAIKIGLVGGYVNKDDGLIYKYRIHFANDSGWAFTFIDQTDDTYSCSTPRNGNHYIDFNSARPSIVGVK